MDFLYYFLIFGLCLALICCWSCLWERVIFIGNIFSNRTREIIKPSVNNMDTV